MNVDSLMRVSFDWFLSENDSVEELILVKSTHTLVPAVVNVLGETGHVGKEMASFWRNFLHWLDQKL